MTKKAFADKLREFRTRMNWSQRRMARFLNVEAMTYGRWENRVSSPIVITQQAILDLLAAATRIGRRMQDERE